MSSDNAKRREIMRPPQPEWQHELESHLADIDSRLTHPRRRATDGDRQPTLPELGPIEVTSELLDEIAWRVAEQIRHNLPAAQHAKAPGRSAEAPGDAPQEHDEPAEPRLQPGKMLMIRYRMPRLPWPFRLLQRRRKRREHPLTTVRVRA